MAWRLLCGMGAWYSPYHMVELDQDASRIPLDPIEVGACADIKALHKSATTGRTHCMSTAMTIIMCLTAFESLFTSTPPQMDAGNFTAGKWEAHLTELAGFGIIKFVEEEEAARIRHINTYFAVPKGEQLARAIFNGKRLSRLMEAPPPVNLPYLPQLLREMALVCGGPVEIYTGDLRHFFHQIPVNDEISRWFGLRSIIRGVLVTMKWLTLPMGWSFSPHIAQSVAWTALLHKEELEADLFEYEGTLNQTPEFLRLKDGAIVTVYYDNIVIIGPHNGDAKRLNGRFLRNAKMFKLSLKVWDEYDAKRLRSERPCFLGAEIVIQRKMNPSKRDRMEGTTSSSSHTYSFQWRHESARLEKWTPRLHQDSLRIKEQGMWTPRELASTIGRIMWRHSLSLQPLCAVAGMIQLIRKLAAFSLSHGWDCRCMTLDQVESHDMQQQIETVLRNPYHCLEEQCPRDASVIYAASDSSDNEWGFVVYNPHICPEESHPTICVEENHRWFHLSDKHIYVKECLAAIEACLSILSGQTMPCIIYLGIDNSAAAAAVRHLHSTNLIVATKLADLAEKLRKSRSAVVPLSLRSVDNAADPVSRGSNLQSRTSDPDLADRCFDLLWSRATTGIIANKHQAQEDCSWSKEGPRHSLEDETLIFMQDHILAAQS